MSLGPFCKAVGIDEEVLGGEKSLTCEPKSITNGVIWELRKYKITKKLATKDILDWLVKICDLKCESTGALENELNEKIEKLTNFRATFLRSPKKYPNEVDRLMKWEFEFPASMGVEATPVFEPVVRASLGPKLLKVLKEKAAADDDSMDMSGPSDDDDEQAKRRKAREEIIQLKKDITTARKSITGMNERLNDLVKRCSNLADASKTSVSERRQIQADIEKLKAEWNDEMGGWHECIDRLNHVNSNKGDYMDVGYMVRRNKTKQGIFDELNFEFDKTLDEFKHKVNALLDKERRTKKKTGGRDHRQKGKSDRKRVRQESDDGDAPDEKKICLADEVKEPVSKNMAVDDFVKLEKVEEFKGGKFVASLKVIYSELTAMVTQCKNIHEIIFTVLDSLENVNAEKIPSQSFSGNIYMEIRMLVLLETYSDLIRESEISFANDSETTFKWVGTSYEVSIPNKPQLTLGILDLSEGSPDTSLNFLKDACSQIMSAKVENVPSWDTVIQSLKSLVTGQRLLDRSLIEVLFLYKQRITPNFQQCLECIPKELGSKVISVNNFCNGLYFMTGLAKLADVTILAWELSKNTGGSGDANDTSHDSNHMLSKAVQKIYDFCQAVEPFEDDEFGKELTDFIKKDKGITDIPLTLHDRTSLFNMVFHNGAGLWFFHEIGVFAEFLEKVKDKDIKSNFMIDQSKEKQSVSIARALGLIGKLIAVPLWTVLGDFDVEIEKRYDIFLKKVENWSKDSSAFMKGKEKLFEDVPLTSDAVYVSLIKSNEANDAITKELLELLFTSFVPYIKSSLYQGSASSTAGNVVNGETAMDADSGNKSSVNSDFTTFDRISKNEHCLATYAHDALMVYDKTRNGEFQDKMGGKYNQKVSEMIQQNTSKQLKSLYKRKIKLSELKDQVSGKKEETSKCQLIEKRYKLIDDLVKWGGLWKSEKEIDERMKDMKETDRINALKSQIRFRRHVLCENQKEGLLDLANEGECFNSTKLCENLKAVLKNECLQTETDVFELASATDDEIMKNKIYDSCKNALVIEDGSVQAKNYSSKENFHWLLGKLVSHTLVQGSDKEVLSGVCIARNKVNGVYSYFFRYKGKDSVYKLSENKIQEDYKNKNLQHVEPSGKDIAGARLSRAFYKDDGDLEWHDCKVIDADSNGPEFVVEFDFYGSDMLGQESETPVPDIEVLTFTTRLLDDYRTDRLRFL